LKILIIIVFSIAFFLGEITSTFSFKKEIHNNIPKIKASSFSSRISNSLSDQSNTKSIDSIFHDLLKRNQIKGASVAVTRKGRLVYARGFGFANHSDSTEAEPWHMFRIASVSKLITAAAIMKLAENNQLNLDDPVFGADGWLNDAIFSVYADKRVEGITINHLLAHTAGWNHKRYDPVFGPLLIASRLKTSSSIGKDELIRYTLEQKLDFRPGTVYSYSNTGYCILGKIIEKASGMPYENYVQFALLHPLGLYNFHIGSSFPDGMPPEEVMYYVNGRLQLYPAFDGSGLRVPLQYGGNNIGLLGPAGGWVSSAPELAKLIASLDGFPGQPDILSKHSVKLMTRYNKKGNSLLGWRGTDNRGTWWRTGTLAGSAALVMRFDNETNWIVLINTTSGKKSRIHNAISRSIYQCMHKMKNWPEVDLFLI
jgi:CubicO group peptidase (beta-lactamase class C family)